MAAQRRHDLVLDSVKRLLRIGATANLLNLSRSSNRPTWPGVSELQDREPRSRLSILREVIAGWPWKPCRSGPEAGARAALDASAEEVAKLVQEIRPTTRPPW